MTMVEQRLVAGRLALVNIWAARLLLAIVAAWFLVGLGLVSGDSTFIVPGLLIAASLVASLRWREVAYLSLAVLFGFGLFITAAVIGLR